MGYHSGSHGACGSRGGMKMGFYFAEVRKLRRELQAAYGAGEYKKALILGKNI